MNKIHLLTFYFCIAFNGCGVFHTKPSVEYLTLEKARYSLFFYGAVHSNTVNDPMFNDIENLLVKHSPNFVLVEGGYDKGTYQTREEAVEAGESAFVTYLASQNRIPVSSIEPPEDYVVSELRYKYSDGAILTMYLLRQVFQLQREATQRKVDFERYLLGFAAAYKEHGLTQSPIHSFSDLQEIVRRESHIELTLDNWQHVNVYDAVYGKEGQTSQIYREVLTMRDEYAAQAIIEKLKQYHRVFVIMGGDHIKNQENKLRKEFNKLNGS